MSETDRPAKPRLWKAAVVAAVTLVVLLLLVLVLPRLGGDTAAGPGDEPSSADPRASSIPEVDETPRDAPPPGEAGSGGAGAPERDPEEGESAPQGEGGGSSDVDNRRPIQAALDEPATPRDDLVLTVDRVEQVRSRAELPGETSRPALRITVAAQNEGTDVLDIGGALTNLYYGPDREAATLVQRPGGRPFPATLAPGDSAAGVFVYNVPPRSRGSIVLEVSLDSSIRRVEFSGDCASGC